MGQASWKDKLWRSAVGGGLQALAVQIFTVTAVLMVAALILMSFTLSSLKTSRIRAETTEDTLLEITTVESRLVDSDRLLNGYVLSQDTWFAVRIAKTCREIDAAMKKLGRSVRRDPEMSAMYKVLVDRLAERQRTYDYLVAHQGEVARVTHSPAAQAESRLTDEVRGRLWDLLKGERAKRYAEHTGMIDEAARSLWIAVGIVGLAILSGMLSLFLASLGPSANKGKRRHGELRARPN
jgi:CHASE3 domain sensor protein